jgi:hypothetical protein
MRHPRFRTPGWQARRPFEGGALESTNARQSLRSIARVVATLCGFGMLAFMTVVRGRDLWTLIPAAFCCVALAGIVAAGHSGLADRVRTDG